MRVLSIGLDSRVGDPSIPSHVVDWVQEMAHHVEEYVVIAESRNRIDHGPVMLADNATAWLIGGSKLAFPFRAARFAERLNTRRAFDIVTTEDPIRAGLAGLLFASKTGVPLNVENHSFHINESIWLREKLHHRVYNRVAISVCRRAASIRNYSDGQVRALRDIGVPEARMHTVPIAAPHIARVEIGVARERIRVGAGPFVLCAGRMVAYKNIELLLKAFADIQVPEAKLVVIGDGSARAGWESSDAARALGDRLIWRGSVPFEMMASYYSAASVFAAPAIHETGPRTVLEATLCGCPVALTPEMGVVRSGICVDGVSAMVMAPDDQGGWTRALEALLLDSALGQRLVTAAQGRIGPDIAFSAIAARLTALLEDTVRSTASSAGPRSHSSWFGFGD